MPSAVSQSPVRAVITGVQIPFGNMVGLILQWMLASIPAIIILWILVWVLMFFGAVLFAALAGAFGH
jgi:hypothetical protein